MTLREPGRILPWKFLYRRLAYGVIGILLLCMLGAVPSFAQVPQLKRPEEAPIEKSPEPPKKKNVKGPRAVGLLQLNSSGKGTLIPVAILIDGKFYDASIYKADPVPMALEGGTVYEVEKTGESQGLFTVNGALHNQNPNSSTPWLGAGAYVLNGTEVANQKHKAEDKPRGMDNEADSDAPPRLTKGKNSAEQSSSPEANKPTQSTGTTNAPAATGSQSGNANSKAAADAGAQSSEDNTGQPQLKRANGSGSNQSTNAQANGQNSGAQPTTSTPPVQGGATAAQSASNKNSAAQSQQGSQDSQNSYHPMLRRGKPTQNAPEDTPDELMKTTEGTALTKTGGDANTGAAKPAVELVPAISDEGGPQPQPYKFYWNEGEEDDRRKQMLELAANEVRGYLAKLAKDTIPAKPEPAKASGKKAGTAGKASATKVDPVFENIEFRAFDVWKNNQPVMIFTAEAHLPEATGASTVSPVYYITIAARTDIYGDLRKLYSGVTDKFHLDVTPRLELIDVVDADGDGRGELLFRETADAGTGYIIYRPTADTLWKMFDSLAGG
jgi:hypothetical protein